MIRCEAPFPTALVYNNPPPQKLKEETINRDPLLTLGLLSLAPCGTRRQSEDGQHRKEMETYAQLIFPCLYIPQFEDMKYQRHEPSSFLADIRLVISLLPSLYELS